MEDEDTYGKIMARKGRTKVIYKGTFVSNRSLLIPRAPPTKSDYDIYKIKDVKECLFNMVYNNNGANDNLGCLHVVSILVVGSWIT